VPAPRSGPASRPAIPPVARLPPVALTPPELVTPPVAVVPPVSRLPPVAVVPPLVVTPPLEVAPPVAVCPPEPVRPPLLLEPPVDVWPPDPVVPPLPTVPPCPTVPPVSDWPPVPGREPPLPSPGMAVVEQAAPAPTSAANQSVQSERVDIINPPRLTFDHLDRGDPAQQWEQGAGSVIRPDRCAWLNGSKPLLPLLGQMTAPPRRFGSQSSGGSWP
jgi:hypothetical protein